jgi:hypothetical protein
MKAAPVVLCASLYCRRDPDTDELASLPAAHGLRLCYPCRDRATNQLQHLGELHDGDLEAALATTSRAGQTVSGTAERGLPLNTTVADARDHVREHLRYWANLVATTRGTTPPRVTMQTVAEWLAAHVDWLAAHPEAGIYAESTMDTWREAMRAAYPHGTRRVPLGLCPMSDCDGMLGALLRPDHQPRPTVIACDTDPGHEWSKAQWMALAPHVHKAPR